MIAVALDHAARGWRVFPVNGKVPRIKGWPECASTNETTIRSWWRQWPRANVGLLCGVSFWALDIDPAAGGDDSLRELETAHGTLPITVEAVTGRLGRHLLFAHDPRVGTGSIGGGIDYRGARGFIVAPGSIHAETKRRYEWEGSRHPDDTPIAVPPEWLVSLVAGRPVFAGDATGPVASSWLAVAFRAAGLLGEPIDGERIAVACPNHGSHSDGRGKGRDASTVVLAPTQRAPLAAFRCFHGHCSHLSTDTVIATMLPNDAIKAALVAMPDCKAAVSRALERHYRRTGS